MNIQAYIQSRSKNFPDATVLARAVVADFQRAGIPVTADTNDEYKLQIDKLLQKMNAKRAPMAERKPIPYAVKPGDHDSKLKAGVDPADGTPLETVVLDKGRQALYNPNNRIVYPIPVK